MSAFSVLVLMLGAVVAVVFWVAWFGDFIERHRRTLYCDCGQQEMRDAILLDPRMRRDIRRTLSANCRVCRAMKGAAGDGRRKPGDD